MKPLSEMTVDELRSPYLCDSECEGRCKLCPLDAWNELARRLRELQKERDAFKSVVEQVWVGASTFRVDPPMTEDELYEQFERIAAICDDVLEDIDETLQP